MLQVVLLPASPSGNMTMARPWITSWGLTWSNNTASLELPNIRARTQRSGLPMSNSGNLRKQLIPRVLLGKSTGIDTVLPVL